MMLVGIGLMWSCSTDELNAPDDGLKPAANTQPGTMTFKATMGGKSLSKSHVAYYDGHTWFDPEDKIGVFSLEGNGTGNMFVIDPNIEYEDKATADFTGPEMTSENGFFAMLPYQENASIATNEGGEGVITMTLPTQQKTVYEELMVGYTPNQDKSFQFAHVGAMLRFATFKKYDKIEIEAPEGTMIAGDNVQVTIDKEGTIDNEVKIKSVTGGTSNKITIDLSNREASAKTDSVLVTILPGTIENLSISFSYNGGEFNHTFEGKMTFESGKMYSYCNVGQVKVICYKESDENSEVLFSRYTYDKDNSYNLIMPKCPLPLTEQQIAEGKLYAYALLNKTSAEYTPTVDETINKNHINNNEVKIYPILVQGVKVHIYGKGPDEALTLDTLAYDGSYIKLPAIPLTPEEGKVYCYATKNSNGTMSQSTYMQGEDYLIVAPQNLSDPVELFAVQTESRTMNVYGNGEGKEPTYTVTAPKGNWGNISYVLPELPERDGYFGCYCIREDGNLLYYYPGDKVVTTREEIKDLDILNIYAIYVEKAKITSTKAYAISDYNGATGVGNENTVQTEYLANPLPKIAKGESAIFKFKNHCNPDLTDITKNVAIRVCGIDKERSTYAYSLSLNPVPSKLNIQCHLEKSYNGNPTTSSFTNFMKNSNGAEITVKITNYGGLIEVECSWNGTDKRTKEHKVKYSELFFWTAEKVQTDNPNNDVFVTFSVTESYIEFLDAPEPEQQPTK